MHILRDKTWTPRGIFKIISRKPTF